MIEEMADVVDQELFDPVLGGQGGDEEEQRKQVKKMDNFGWALTALAGVCAGLNGLYAVAINHPAPHNAHLLFYLLVLHWSTCLD